MNDGSYVGGFEQKDLAGLFDAMLASYSDWAKSFEPIAVAGSVADPAVKEFARGLLALRPDVALSIAVTIFRSDLRRELARVTVPCEILQTRQDAAVPLEVAEYLRSRRPGSVLEIIDANGHVPQVTAPDAVRDALLRHLAWSDIPAVA